MHLYRNLKLTPCPHCKITGALILHGRLFGYAEHEDHFKTCRGRRIFCSNRKKRKNGCGHTFSIWGADKLGRLRIGTNTLWAFVKLVLSMGNKALALRTLNVGLSCSSAYRIWTRFVNGQSRIRTALTQRCPPPDLPRVCRPAEQTVAHLQAVFPHAPCPIAAFQQQLQIAFL